VLLALRDTIPPDRVAPKGVCEFLLIRLVHR
jgi:hypothetical protein